MLCRCVLLLLIASHILLAAGDWGIASNPEQTCEENRLCTNNNSTWSTHTTYTKESACAVLASKGLQNITFYGDSFQRHFYIGLALLLTGNYRHGALEEGEQTCDFNAQFEEKRCRLKLRLSSMVCNDTVTLRYDTANPTLESICKQPPDSLVLWSMGNHPLNEARRGDDPLWGRNSVPHYVAYILEGPLCPYAVAHPANCRLWWVTTHQRLNNVDHTGFPTEAHSVIHNYNMGMRAWFEAGNCGPAHVVDVYNMTHALVATRPEEAKPLTHDGFHWSMVVNLVKVQILLNDIATVLPSVLDAAAAPTGAPP